MSKHTILFLPDSKKVEVESNVNILDAAKEVGIQINSACGRKGTCGRCAVIVKEGKVNTDQTAKLSKEQIANGYRLACQTTPLSDLIIEIPNESRISEHQVLVEDDKKPNRDGILSEELIHIPELDGNPLFRKVHIKLSAPTLDDNIDDLSRLETALRKETGVKEIHFPLDTIKVLGKVLRDGNWEVTVFFTYVNSYIEVAKVEPGLIDKKCYGLAIDIGTTTVVVYLVDLESGESVDVKGTYNKQAAYGDDVISRIIHADETAKGLQELHQAVIDTINELTDDLLTKNNIEKDEVYVAVCAGNTTMSHMLLGIDPKYIRLEPYIPTVNSIPPVRAKQLDININPEGWIHNLPNIASYVGGDITSGVMVTGMSHFEPITLLIDIGTNGEMVLGNNEWLVACACSAGPAFEGGGIEFGMRAMKGAIERITITKDLEVNCSVIGNEVPIGICGSGLIDGIATMRRAEVIDRTGRFSPDLNTDRLRETDEGKEFVLVWAKDSGGDQDITISENDIKNLLRSKGAIFAGIRVMLDLVQLPVEAIDQIYIAGGFGNYINIKDAITIGLLPDIPLEKYKFIGNSSVKGAKKALLSHKARIEVEQVARKMTYLELSVGNTFMDEFVSALFLPHTDLSLFPSVKE